MTMITASLLRAVMPAAGARAEVFAEALEYARSRYIGEDPDDVAHWLAQVAHESGQLRYTRELADGSAYEGRTGLGNVQPGDGRRFRGRGLIQLTGRDNYTRYGVDAHVDSLGQPELLEQLPYSADVAGWFWKVNNISSRTAGAVDRVLAVTKIVNGGTNGLAERRQFYAAAKEALSGVQAPAPIEHHDFPPEPVETTPEPSVPVGDVLNYGESKHMLPIIPIITAVLPSLISAIPQLGKLFGSGSEVSDRNIAAATKVLETVTQATGAVNALEAAEKIAANPAAQQAAQQAVQAIWFELTEAGGGGIDGARKADAAAQASGWVPWRSASFMVALMLTPLIYMIVYSVAFIADAGWDPAVRASIATGVISLVLGGICGYHLGSMTGKQPSPGK